jgi:hypothetical protein
MEAKYQYPKCIYKNGEIGVDNITVNSIEEETKANETGYWDCRAGKVETWSGDTMVIEKIDFSRFGAPIPEAIELSPDIPESEPIKDHHKKPGRPPRGR